MTPFPDAHKVVIRPMEQNDIEHVQEIDHISFSLPWPKSAFNYELNHNLRSRLWVAEMKSLNLSGQVVGMVIIWLILDEAHIATLAIHPNYRGHGIAHQLLIHALNDAVGQGAQIGTLEVRANNLTAQRLYSHLGFTIVGRRPHFYRDNNEDALIMTVFDLGYKIPEWQASNKQNPGVQFSGENTLSYG
jgi:ribosomal-protein-alanine N-acetyltransferase